MKKGNIENIKGKSLDDIGVDDLNLLKDKESVESLEKPRSVYNNSKRLKISGSTKKMSNNEVEEYN